MVKYVTSEEKAQGRSYVYKYLKEECEDGARLFSVVPTGPEKDLSGNNSSLGG